MAKSKHQHKNIRKILTILLLIFAISATTIITQSPTAPQGVASESGGRGAQRKGRSGEALRRARLGDSPRRGVVGQYYPTTLVSSIRNDSTPRILNGFI